MTSQPSRSVIGRSIAAAGNTSERRAQATPIATKPTNAIKPVRKCGGTAAIIPSTNVPTRNASPTLIVVRKNVPQPGGNRLWAAVSPSSTKRCQRTMNTVPNTANPAGLDQHRQDHAKPAAAPDKPGEKLGADDNRERHQ